MSWPRKHVGTRFIIALFVLSVPAGEAVAQVYGSGNHTVTVQVSVITKLSVTAAAVNLNVTSANAVAGQNAMTVSNQSSQILWGVNSSLRKITARSNLAAPTFQVQLVAVNPTRGTAAAQQILSTTAKDLLLNIGRSLGSATLGYSATVLASQGTGTDAHTITFTITAQ
jgi:hypothetical protein